MSEHSLEQKRDVYTVARLNREIKALLEGRFPLLWVEGELSNLSRPSSGHVYFTLKDSQAQVRCAWFRGNQRAAGSALRDGLQVLVRARVSLYDARGDYQLIVETLEDAGEGALRRAFEELKQRLLQEGLFDPEHKQSLPRLPRRLGIMTSPSGAVLHDILTTLKRRFSAIPVLLYPVPVQGDGAAEKISAMLRLAGQRNECEALILARGGGSLEDLQAFNSEIVARAIHACPIPVVTGIGHETDITIADFVADARAPTPTAAAELLSPDGNAWLATLDHRHRQLRRLIQDQLDEGQQRLDGLRARLIHPRDRLAQLRETLAAHSRHLLLLQQQARHRTEHRLLTLRTRLMQQSPRTLLSEHVLRGQHLYRNLVHAAQQRLLKNRERCAHLAGLLATLSPLATLARGYAILEHPDGRIVRQAGDADLGDSLRARLTHGALVCRVEKIENT